MIFWSFGFWTSKYISTIKNPLKAHSSNQKFYLLKDLNSLYAYEKKKKLSTLKL